IAYIGADTTISCTHRDVNFICKQSLHTCDILSRGPELVYHISDVSRQDQGVYWCGYESRNGNKVSREKIDLQGKKYLVTTEDSGSYWFGTERIGNKMKIFNHSGSISLTSCPISSEANMTILPSTTHPGKTCHFYFFFCPTKPFQRSILYHTHACLNCMVNYEEL
uniref:Immunoglobulin subtype domain-containing protein n=1 Tax=Neogobius melanostomus TaxID=47308 RepID=A0A8C6SCB6_9GOBI